MGWQPLKKVTGIVKKHQLAKLTSNDLHLFNMVATLLGVDLIV